jgi:hypothetical protein
MDDKKNNAKVRVIGTYNATATSITVDDASRLPTAPFNTMWWDEGNYPDSSDDNQREIVRVAAITGNVLTLASSAGNRVAQETSSGGLASSTKDTANTTYIMASGWTAKDAEDLDASTIDVGDAYCWITEHGATGDGTTDDKAAFDAAVSASRTYIVCPSGTWRIASNLTLANTITLECLPGCSLAPDTGATLTINGDLVAGNYQIFGGSGTVTVGSRNVRQYARWAGTTEDWATGGDTVVESAALDVSTTGVKTCTIAHGLGSAPAATEITLTTYRSSGSNNFEINGPWIQSIDGTNINVYFEVTTLATGTNAKVVARIHHDV